MSYKKSRNYRIDQHTTDIMDRIAEITGLNHTQIIEKAIRAEATQRAKTDPILEDVLQRTPLYYNRIDGRTRIGKV